MATDGDVLEKLHRTFEDALRHQLETLSAILEHNGGVSYLRRYLRGCDVPVDAAAFRRAVPLSCCHDYADHIDKLADGILTDDHGQPLLSVDPLLCFFYSSGTSSMNPKLLPHFDSKRGRYASSLAHQASAATLRRVFPPRSAVNKVLGFIYAGNVTQTKGGYKAMAATAFPLHSTNSSQFLSTYIAPKDVILGTDVNQQMYCHLLCGLRHFDSIDGVSAPYAAGLIKAFALLESKWEKLCEDLEKGVPSSEITDVAMRQSVTAMLGGPQPDLSRHVSLICEETSWEGIVPKLWPNSRYVKCVATGSMMQYYAKLKYYAGVVPVLGANYFASECCVAVNMDIFQPPELTRYAILPTAAYFEFLPFDNIDKSCVEDEERTVDISSVEVGKLYEVVVTTFRGLYRLRLGDIVKVVGFNHTAPLLEFVMRAPKTCDEFITERDLLSAMASFQLALKNVTQVVEFASFMDMESDPKQLTIFVEVKDECNILLQNDKCLSVVEDCLGSKYQVMKARNEIGPLRVSIVKCGSFDGLLKEAIKSGTTASQYKPPNIIRCHKILDHLEMSIVAIL